MVRQAGIDWLPATFDRAAVVAALSAQSQALVSAAAASAPVPAACRSLRRRLKFGAAGPRTL
jgi:hypothetical protein